MHLKTKLLGIEAGGPYIVVLSPKIAHDLDLGPSDRVRVMSEKKYVVAIADFSSTIKDDEIGLFEEVREILNASDGAPVTIIPEEKPASIQSIKKKLDGSPLSKDEIFEIVTDIVDNRLATPEIAMFVAAAYTKGFSLQETENMTRAMAETGEMLKLSAKKVLDVHSIGGVPGNRTTLIIVPIVAATGAFIPKTASRAITDPAGTADVMEVLAPVTLGLQKIKEIVTKHKGCIVWGGGLDLAPADDDIIKIEQPLQMDPTAMLISSILAKKYAIGATDVLMEIPYGKGTKCDRKRADDLEKRFLAISSKLGMKMKILKTEGSETVGNGIGPALEARDCLWVLERDKHGPKDLEHKSVRMAGILLERTGLAGKGRGTKLAQNILDSGKALHRFKEIVKAQGGNPNIKSGAIALGKYDETVFAEESGRVKYIDSDVLKKLGRHLGAPHDKGAGIYLYKHVGAKVKEGDKLFSLYAESGRKLSEAIEFTDTNKVFTIK